MIGTIISALGNYGLGAGIKIFSSVAGTLLENKHQYMMATSMASAEKIKAMNDGEDTLTDKMSRRTRSILAFIVIGTFSACVLYIVAFNPKVAFVIQVDTIPGMLTGIFSNSETKGTLTISGGDILFRYMTLVEIVCGFYFTKVGKRV
jgi:hypothetical protein